jgi:hypothetical protein
MSTNTAPSTASPALNDEVSSGSNIALSFTLDEARVLRTVAQRGMLATGAEGAPSGQPQQAKAALDKLGAAVEEAEVVRFVRDELEQAGFETSRLSNAQVSSLARRLADVPRRASPRD